jgi:hypothetical protein
MSDLTITATAILAGTDADFFQGLAGETITAGQSVYLDSLTNRVRLADANASLATAAAIGISLHGATAGQPIRVQTGGSITLGVGTLALIYVVSATAGGIAPSADIASGWYTTLLGVHAGDGVLKMSVFASQAQLAA